MVRALRTVVLIFALVNVGCNDSRPRNYVEARPLMGTLVEITVADVPFATARPAVDAAFARMNELSDSMNHYNPHSLVSRINQRAGQSFTPVTTELFEVLNQAAKVSERTQGAFDITIASIKGWNFDPEKPAMPEPEALERMRSMVNYRDVLLDSNGQQVKLKRVGMRIDLGGIAKLYIIDQGMQQLRSKGIAAAMINGGGDIQTIGAPGNKPWSIGIRDPWAPDRLYARVSMRDGYVVSSGDYERFFIKDGKRYHHILDPRTGQPTQGLRQVTLLAEDLGSVNGLSAAIMVSGATAGLRLLGETPQVEFILMGADHEVRTSPGLGNRLELAPAGNAMR